MIFCSTPWSLLAKHIQAVMNLLHVSDEITDVSDGKSVGDIRDIVMDTLCFTLA